MQSVPTGMWGEEGGLGGGTKVALLHLRHIVLLRSPYTTAVSSSFSLVLANCIRFSATPEPRNPENLLDSNPMRPNPRP